MKALMYHYVREYDPALPGLNFLHINDFVSQLDFLSNEFGFVEKQEFIDSIKKKASCPPGVVLTFDDGLKDHFRYVLPELKKRGLWGIFYIPTGVFDKSRMLNVQKVQFLLGKYGGIEVLKQIRILQEEMVELRGKNFKIDENTLYVSQTNFREETLVKKIINYQLNLAEKDKITSLLLKKFGQDEQELSRGFYLSKKEIIKMEKEGMVIGSHGIDHNPMANLTHHQSKREIEDSFSFLEDLLVNQTLKTFCYPHGLISTFGKKEEILLEDNNVDFSFAVESRDVTTNDLLNNIQSLPRYDCNEFNHGGVYRHES